MRESEGKQQPSDSRPRSYDAVVVEELTIRPYREGDERGWVVCRVLAFLDSPFFEAVRQTKERYEHPAIELVAERAGEIVGLIDIECEEAPETVATISAA